METGLLDMIRRWSDVSLSEPEFTDSSGFKTTIWRAKPPHQIKGQSESFHTPIAFQRLSRVTDTLFL